MTYIDVEQLKASRLLYDLAQTARAERNLWHDRHIRRELEHVAQQLELAGRHALSEGIAYGDAWAEAGTLTIRSYVNRRRLLQNVTSRSTLGHTLDCRDGRHMACSTCDCYCHEVLS